MDAGDIFNRGASITRILNLTDTDTEAAIDIATLDDIICTVYHSVTSRILGTYSLGAGTVTTIDAANGQIRFIVPKSVTATADLGVYYCNIRTEETDANYEDNTRANEKVITIFKLNY